LSVLLILDKTQPIIAGYTPAGFPYGITWEEREEIDKDKANNPHQATPYSAPER
jgi:hypothetical protein